MLVKEMKREIIEQFRLKEGDSGSVGVQVALLTGRIRQLTEHLKLYPRDCHSRHALLRLVGRQRKLMAYLSRTAPERYRSLGTKLGLRK
jgi:small subunit ribosomal protein S15